MNTELTPKESRTAAIKFYRKAEQEQDKTKQYELLDEAFLLFSNAGEEKLAQQCVDFQTGKISF